MVADTTTFTASKVDQVLFPVQRVVLKAMYGIPLDDNPNNRFEVTNWDGSVRAEYTEAEYLRGIHRHGRSSISEVTPGKEYQNVCLVAGRRSGKGLLTSAIARYEATRNPIPNVGNNVAVVGPTWSMLEHVRNDIARDVDQDHDDGRFKSISVHTKTIEVSRFWGPKSRIHFTSAEKSLCGFSIGTMIMDEFDHDNTPWESYPSSKRIMLSSPNNPENSKGDFYRCFQSGLLGCDDTLSLQIPTWEMNPLVPASAYKAEKERDEFMFLREFGAQFRPKKTTILVVMPSQQ
jgi:hypothetical protein